MARWLPALGAAVVGIAVVASAVDPPTRPHLLVLVDASASMARSDGTSSSRLDRVDEALQRALPPWEERFDVEIRPFGRDIGPPLGPGARVEREPRPGSEPPDDLSEIGGTPCAVIVVSDGAFARAPRPLTGCDAPIHTIGVGDPAARALLAGAVSGPTLVLRGDIVELALDIRGGSGSQLRPHVALLASDGRAIEASNAGWHVVVDGSTVRARRRFEEAGRYLVRVGVEPRDGDSAHQSAALHVVHVSDAGPRVLYVEGPPRWEFNYLRNALSRDRRVAHGSVLLADGGMPSVGRGKPRSSYVDLHPGKGLPSRESIDAHDVVILGDVDLRSADGQRFAGDVRAFVQDGGGLLLAAGVRHNPRRLRDTVLEDLVPVELDRAFEAADPVIDTSEGMGFVLTEAGRKSDVMDVADHPEVSRNLWENHPSWRQYWSYPTARAKPGATVLAESSHPAHSTAAGRRPLICHGRFGRGRVWFVGVEELWRMRRESGDRYFWRFYSRAIRALARDRLLHTKSAPRLRLDRAACALGDSVTIAWDGALSVVTVRGPDGSASAVGTANETDPSATIVPGTSGLHHVELADPGAAVSDSLPLRVEARTDEPLTPNLDESALRALSASSPGGHYRPLSDLDGQGLRRDLERDVERALGASAEWAFDSARAALGGLILMVSLGLLFAQRRRQSA